VRESAFAMQICVPKQTLAKMLVVGTSNKEDKCMPAGFPSVSVNALSVCRVSSGAVPL
jgi:hypothetical protein